MASSTSTTHAERLHHVEPKKNLALHHQLQPAWLDSAAWGKILIACYVLIAILPVLIAFLFPPVAGEPLLVTIGKATGLAGFSVVFLQVMLTARFRPIDRPYGLDQVTYFHTKAATLAGILLLLHPLLIILGGQHWGLLSFSVPWPINLGKLALIFLWGAIIFAWYFFDWGIEYQTWRRMHKFIILVPVLGFIHSIYAGDELQQGFLRSWWIGLIVVAAGIFLYRNIGRLYFGPSYRVASVLPESHDTYTIQLEPEKGKCPPHRPGQFMFLRIRLPNGRSEEHPFTISSTPSRECPMCATIKESGDFTDQISHLRQGDSVLVEAPFGRYSFMYHDPVRLVYIAGGVGITPIMSMLRYIRDSELDIPVTLIWGNKSRKDILFQKELDSMKDKVRTVHVLSEPEEDWEGEKGYVTREILEKYVQEELQDADVFLCGPAPMMKKVKESLGELGVPPERIHTEKFGL
jgi:predicted ferric reductase